MNRKYKELSKNTILFTISSLGTKLISFFLVPLYTYVLTTEEYGSVDLINTTVSLLLPVLTLNIQDAVLRFTLDKKYEPSNIISIAINMVVKGSVLLACGLTVLTSMGILKLSLSYIIFLWISFTSHAFYNCIQMYEKAIDDVKTLVAANLVSTFLNCMLNIILLLWSKLGVLGYLIALSCSSLSSILICLFSNRNYRTIHITYKNREVRKQMITYSKPLILNSLSWWINSASDRYIITFFLGIAANGIYSVSYKIPTILSTFQTIFYNAWSVSAIKEFDRQDKDGFIGNIYSFYSTISVLGCSLILILNPYISKLLYAKEFYQAWEFTPFLLIGTLFNGMSLIEGALFTAVKKTKTISSTTMVGALVNTVLNFSLIYFIGVQGAAVATMMGYITVWIVRTVRLQTKVISLKINWLTHLLSLTVIIVQSVFAVLYGTNYIQCVAFLGLIILNYYELRRLVRSGIKRIGRGT